MRKCRLLRNCLVLLPFVIGPLLCRGTAQQGAQGLPAPPPDEQRQATTTLHVTSQLVFLDVVVTNKAGALQPNLTKDDFHVTEGGVPQKILHFEAPAEHVLPTGVHIHSTQDLEKQAPQAPVTVIVLDEINTRFEDMGYARYALNKYLNAQPTELSAPTMLVAISSERLQVLADYTEDRAAILEALKKHLTNYPWEMLRNPNRIRQMLQSLGALEQVAEATAGHPGHKNLLWVGHGFAGVELSNPNIDPEQADALKAAVEQAVDMLRDSRMTLSTIDPTALSSTVSETQDDDSGPLGDIVDPGTDPFIGDVNFIGLAKATGGKSFFSRNDVDAEIGESARDGLNYYTIAYRPSIPSDDARAYRKIRVTFTQPGLRAGMRDGYYPKDSVELVPSANRSVYDIDAAIENTMTYTGLEVHAVARPGQPGDYVVGVPEKDLQWDDSGEDQSSKLTIAVANINAKGKILRRVTTDLTARRKQDAQDADATKLVRSDVNLPVVPGTTRLRIVVRAAGNSRIGSTDLDLAGTAPPGGHK